jgi:hypothetical protein
MVYGISGRPQLAAIEAATPAYGISGTCNSNGRMTLTYQQFTYLEILLELFKLGN